MTKTVWRRGDEQAEAWDGGRVDFYDRYGDVTSRTFKDYPQAKAWLIEAGYTSPQVKTLSSFYIKGRRFPAPNPGRPDDSEQCEFCGARGGVTGFKALSLCPKCLAEYKARRTKAGLSNPAFRGGHLLSGAIDWSTDVKHEGDPNAEDVAWEKRRAVAAVMKLIGPDLAKWQAKTRFKFTGFRYEFVVWHLSSEQEDMPEDEQGEPSEPKWHYSLSFIGPAAMVIRIVKQFGGTWKMSNPGPRFRDYPGGKVYGSVERGRFADEMQADRFMVEKHLEDGFYRKDKRTGEYVVYSYKRNSRGLTRQGPACYATGMARRNPHELYISKARRDARFKELKARGVAATRRSIRGQQLHPQYIKDAREEGISYETGFGNTDYRSLWPVLYSVDFTENPYTRVRFPAHTSHLFRSKKSGRWTSLPGRRRNPIVEKGKIRLMVGMNGWAFVMGDSYTRFGDFPMTFRSRSEAVRAADSLGLKVDKRGFVSVKNPMMLSVVKHIDGSRTAHAEYSRSRPKLTRLMQEHEATARMLKDAGYSMSGVVSDGKAAKMHFHNPAARGVLIGRKVLSVTYLDEAKARRCGAKNPSVPWKHDFSSADAKVYGLPDGSVLIKSDKKKLWGYR